MMMKIKPKMYLEIELDIVHCYSGDGMDFTLCGFSLDNDQEEIKQINCDVKIDCPVCIRIIEFCKSISRKNY